MKPRSYVWDNLQNLRFIDVTVVFGIGTSTRSGRYFETGDLNTVGKDLRLSITLQRVYSGSRLNSDRQQS